MAHGSWVHGGMESGLARVCGPLRSVVCSVVWCALLLYTTLGHFPRTPAGLFPHEARPRRRYHYYDVGVALVGPKSATEPGEVGRMP